MHSADCERGNPNLRYDVLLVGTPPLGAEGYLAMLVEQCEEESFTVWHTPLSTPNELVYGMSIAHLIVLLDTVATESADDIRVVSSLFRNTAPERFVALRWSLDGGGVPGRSPPTVGFPYEIDLRNRSSGVEGFGAVIRRRLPEVGWSCVVSEPLTRRVRGGEGISSTAPAAPTGSHDTARFSVFAPSSIAPGSNFVLDLWMHLGEQTDLVEEYARAVARERRLALKTSVLVERDTVLEAALELRDLEVLDSCEPILWTGEPANCSFPVRVPPQLPPGSYPGIVRLSIDAIAIARIHFIVAVGATPSSEVTARCSGGTLIPRSAFACYSSEDRDEVIGRVQGMMKVLPSLDIYLDILNLRSGDDWANTIRPHIDSKDVFYLFWSAPAARSKAVEREWKYALEKRGLSYINPVPLMDPRLAPPPTLLEKLHFNESFLAHVEVHRRIRALRRKRQWWRVFGGQTH